MTTMIKTREMRWQPFWRDRDVFWSRAEQHKHESGSFPEWVFDFISIHDHYDGGFRLISPLCIADRDQRSSRPRWEQKTFETLGKAIAVSKRLARLYSRTLNQRIHVVYCPSAPSQGN